MCLVGVSRVSRHACDVARARAHGVSLSPVVLRVCVCVSCVCLCVRPCACVCVCARVGALCACVRVGARARAQGLVILAAGAHPHLLESPTGRIHAIFGHCVGALHASDSAGSDCKHL